MSEDGQPQGDKALCRATALHDLLVATARRTPLSPALRSRGVVWTYGELDAHVMSLACALDAAGVRAGDRVVINLQNRPEFVAIAFACSRIGAIFVPANPVLKSRQLEHLLKDSGATVLIASHRAVLAIQDVLARAASVRTLVLCDSTGPLPQIGSVDTVRFEDLLGDAGAQGALLRTPIAADPAALFYTSGSTGRAKGVIVSHGNLVEGAHIVAGYLRNTADDRILAALPLSFDYGFSQVTTAIAVGACAVLTNFALPAALLQEIVAERITGLAGVPAIWMHLLSVDWPAGAGSTLRYVTNSGGALPPAVIKQLQGVLPQARIFCMYGLTEAFRSTYLDPDQLTVRAGSIGKAIPGQQIRVLRSDGSECLPDEPGELVHRGSLVTLGYWNDPETTARRFRPIPVRHREIPREEIAVWSGDMVRRDAEGYLYFIGRTDALIKSSGYRISPIEIEEIVCEVDGVVESAALGFPDEALGQRVVVAVIGGGVADIAERVRQHCRVHLPPYMVPTEVHVLREFPRNPNGKCDRKVLQEQLTALEPRVSGRGANCASVR